MKKLLIVMTLVLCATVANANIKSASNQPNAIGVRAGGGNMGNGAELSYQKAMSSINRLELDLGWAGGDHFSWLAIAGIYQWCWNIQGGFNWYAGPGAQVGLYSYDNSNNNNDDGLTLGVGGQIGIEYDFNVSGVPLLISLDIRPMMGFLNHDGFGHETGLGLRYTF